MQKIYNIHKGSDYQLRSFFKSIKRLILLILIIVIFVAGYFIKDGYDYYKAAMEEMSLEARVKDLRQKHKDESENMTIDKEYVMPEFKKEWIIIPSQKIYLSTIQMG